MKKLITIALLGLVLTSLGGFALVPGSTADAEGHDNHGCYTTTCVHTYTTACTHYQYITVYCSCHYAGWHYEYRTMHSYDIWTRHSFDWVCFCGRHGR